MFFIAIYALHSTIVTNGDPGLPDILTTWNALRGQLGGIGSNNFLPNGTDWLRQMDNKLCESNPAGCSTASEWGRAIGVPLENLYEDSLLGKLQNNVAGILLSGYNRATLGVTPTFVHFVQQDAVRPALVDFVVQRLGPIVTIPYDTGFEYTMTNISSFVWDPINNHATRLRTENDEVSVRLERERLAQEAACLISNNKLPGCVTTTTTMYPNTDIVVDSGITLSTALDPETGFRLEVLVMGVGASCYRYDHGCPIGGQNNSPEQFDGIYRLQYIDDAGNPVYAKFDVFFPHFLGVTSLWLFSSNYYGPMFPTGVSAMISPQTPDFRGLALESRHPFVYVLGNSPKCLIPTDFPTCLSMFLPVYNSETDSISITSPEGWVIARSVFRHCPVPRDPFSLICQLHVTVAVI